MLVGLTSPSSAAPSLPDLLATLGVRAGGAAEPEPFEMTAPMLAGWDGIRSGQRLDSSSSSRFDCPLPDDLRSMIGAGSAQ